MSDSDNSVTPPAGFSLISPPAPASADAVTPPAGFSLVGQPAPSDQSQAPRGFVQGLRDWADKADDLSDMPKRYAEGAPEWVRDNIMPVVALPEAITRKAESAGARGMASFVQGTEDLADVAYQKDDPHTRALNAQIAGNQAPADINAAITMGATPFDPEGAAVAPKARVLRYPEAQQNLQDFDRSGITATAPAVTESHTLGNMANVNKEIPLVGSGIIKAAQTQADQAAGRARDIAAGYGPATSDVEGANALTAGYQKFKYGPTGAERPPPVTDVSEIFQPTRKVGFVPKSEALYDRIPIESDLNANVGNTVNALGRLSNQFPSNPELNQILAAPAFSKLLGAIKPGVKEVASESPVIMQTGRGWATGQAPARISGAPAQAAEMPSSPMISLGDNGFQLTPGGRSSVQQIAPGYNLAAEGADAIAPTGRGFATTDATELQPTGGMSWQDLKNFRSYVGRQMRQPSDQLGLGRDDWKTLYGSISQDMRDTATDQSPEALGAFNRANSYYAKGLDRLNNAMDFVDKANSDEGAFTSLLNKGNVGKSTSDISRFAATMKSMPDDEKGEITSAIVNRLGRPDPGAMTAAENQTKTGPFSFNKWNTNYASMSPTAKDAVFGSTGTSRRDDLDALSNSIAALSGVKKLGNPSGTGRFRLAEKFGPLGLVADAVTSPLRLAASVGAGAVTSEMLTSPGFARWLANSTKVETPQGWTSQMARLGNMATQNPTVIGPYFRALTQSTADQNQQRAHGGRINAEAAKAHPSPSDPQKKAGNYRMGHCKIHGLDISIENAKNSVRRGVGPGGKKWAARLGAHYGYIRKTMARDGDQVDVFIGPDEDSDKVFLIDQLDHRTGKYDEAKALMNFPSIASALDAYAKSFSDGHGHDRIGNVKTMTVDQLKDWLKNGDTTQAIAA